MAGKKICTECTTINNEEMWFQIGDKWACAYCYNSNFSKEQIERIRAKELKKNLANGDRG